MPYTPVATDGTNPLDTTDRSTAAAEFRALKSYIQTTILAAIAAATPSGQVTKFAGVVIPAGYLHIPNAASVFNATTYKNLAYVLGNSWGVGGGNTFTDGTPGGFVVGNTYIIATLGTTTNWNTVGGLASPAVGSVFTAIATGSGGDGTAFDSVSLPFVPTGYTFAQAALALQSVGVVLAHTHGTGEGFYGTGGNGGTSGGNGTTTTTVSQTPTGGAANLAASVGINYIIKT